MYSVSPTHGRLSDILILSGRITSSPGYPANVFNNDDEFTSDSYLRPAVPLGLVLVVGPAGLQHGLVNPAAAGHNAHHGPVGGGDHLLSAGWQLHPTQKNIFCTALF